LEGEGWEAGVKDKEQFEKLKDKVIDKNSHPNLFRWHSLLSHKK